jgi:alkanesulfonate monooxygenase SsuD/methylene tetrahydromethanopterin reductase-like flavin-dependent oxidoreductase (luciferase family)
MKIGMALSPQNCEDWDRFLASEQHDDVPARPSQSDAELMDADIALALEAEELGFDAIFCPEHHFTPYTFSPNPLQLLTYLAGRTERVDLGTMVVVLPWHHPLRVAEEATMLQNLIGSNRDLLLGFGRGLARREYNSFGVNQDESRQRFAESVEIIRLALTQDRFSYAGAIYDLPEMALRPYPRDQRLIDNLYCAWGSPQSAPIAGELGLKPFLIPQKPLPEYEAEMLTYADTRAAHGHAPADPMIVMWVYCAETDEEARLGAEAHMRAYVRTPVLHYELGSSHFAQQKGYENYADAAKAVEKHHIDLVETMTKVWLDNHIWGTPEQCIEKIRSLHETYAPTHLICSTKYGTMSLEEAQRSTRLFAKEVIPAVHELTGAKTAAVVS